jgi:hypothetical protein
VDSPEDAATPAGAVEESSPFQVIRIWFAADPAALLMLMFTVPGEIPSLLRDSERA